MAATIKGAAVRFRTRWHDGLFRAQWRDNSGIVALDAMVRSTAIISTALGTVNHFSGATSALSPKVRTSVVSEPVSIGN